MQNREMIMHKVGKWFMIIGIAGLLSLLFIEWSRWNLVPLSEKINLVRVSEIYREFHTEFIGGEIFENYVIVIVLSMCIYVKNILEMIQKLYHWITTEPEENHYDIVKMTFIWMIIAFIIGKIW